MKSIFVTGGAGYIGSHTCKRLASCGYQPVTYDNLSTGHREFVKWGPLVEGDLHDGAKIVEALQHYRPVAVIHFAASAYVGESVAYPFKYYWNNVSGTLSLLEAMQRTQVDRLVFSSSCATYGAPEAELISEDCTLNPINPYGRSKLMLETVLRDLSSAGALTHVSLRYFNAAGADPDGDIGEWHEPEPHLIPLAIRAGLGGDALRIFGTDFPTPDGTAVRDYIHVDDLAQAHILAVEHLLAGNPSDFINLGTGRGHSVQEVVSALRTLGLDVKTKAENRRAGDPACLVADASKANKVLNWQPRFTQIADILRTAVHWHRKHG